MNKRLEKQVVARYRRDAARLSTLLPETTLSIEDLNQGQRHVKLHSGDLHLIDDEEAKRLVERIPPYFWRLMRVPIVFKYIRYEDGTRRYVVMGDTWQRRLVEILLTGDYSSEGVSELEIDEFTRLLGEYKTIIFVTVSL